MLVIPAGWESDQKSEEVYLLMARDSLGQVKESGTNVQKAECIPFASNSDSLNVTMHSLAPLKPLLVS